jgi:hypothetical protein
MKNYNILEKIQFLEARNSEKNRSNDDRVYECTPDK